MNTVTSRDGTTIAYERSGSGPALLVVGGAFSSRSAAPEFVKLLAQRLTVYAVDRRGRGDSGDTQPYAVERELEDVEALIDAVGDPVFVYGGSSGGVLSLRAAAKLGDKITKLVLYEPPFIIDDSRPPAPVAFVEHLDELVEAGRRGDAVEYFMTEVVGTPTEALREMRESPAWPGMEKLAHTLAYDGRVVGNAMSGSAEPLQQWATLQTPTLVLNGSNSPPFLHDGARTLAAILPNGHHRSFKGLDHAAAIAAPQTLAPVFLEFLLG